MGIQDQYEEGVLYAEDPIMYDEGYARSVMSAIAEASVAVEEAFGAPQDIEGVIKEDGSLYIVQTRPQVLGPFSTNLLVHMRRCCICMVVSLMGMCMW